MENVQFIASYPSSCYLPKKPVTRVFDRNESVFVQTKKVDDKGWFKKWLSDEDKISCDGKDDGKISFKEKLKSFGKGLLCMVKAAVKHPLATASFVIGGTLLTMATGGAILPVLIAAGVTIGAAQIGMGAYKAICAKTDGEAKAAWENMGAGTFSVATSVLGAKGALNGASKSGVANLENAGKLNIFQATAKCYQVSGSSLKTSGLNIAKNSSSLVLNIKNYKLNRQFEKRTAQEIEKIIPKPETLKQKLSPQQIDKEIENYLKVYNQKQQSEIISALTDNLGLKNSRDAKILVEKYVAKILLQYLKKNPENLPYLKKWGQDGLQLPRHFYEHGKLYVKRLENTFSTAKQLRPDLELPTTKIPLDQKHMRLYSDATEIIAQEIAKQAHVNGPSRCFDWSALNKSGEQSRYLYYLNPAHIRNGEKLGESSGLFVVMVGNKLQTIVPGYKYGFYLKVINPVQQ